MQGIADIITGILGAAGINADTSAAVERAFASPTLVNIQSVEDSFAAAGTSAPPELMQSLYERYYQAVRDNPLWAGGGALQTLSQWLPYLVIGGAALFLFSKAGKK